MVNYRDAVRFAVYDLRKWRKNPRIIVVFSLLLILCLTLTDEYVSYAVGMGMPIQVFEPFIIVFTGKYTMIYLSLLILMAFNDVPFLEVGLPYYLIRSNRKSWVLGQLLYILISSFIVIGFAMAVCLIAGIANAFAGNMWSEAAVFVANGGALDKVEPISLEMLINSLPLTTAASIYGLILLYTLFIGCVMFVANLFKSKYVGTLVVGVMIFIGYISAVQWLGPKFAWASILVHANYASHSFLEIGALPRVSDSYLLFSVMILVLVVASYYKSRTYQFSFSGDQQ